MSQGASIASWILGPDRCPPTERHDAMKPGMKSQGSITALMEDEIAHLRGLDLKGLRTRWHGTFRKQAPAHLPRHLLFGLLAYRLQADRLGDLDHDILKMLDRIEAGDMPETVSQRLIGLDQRRASPTPGTVLVREWNDTPQRVMVLAGGFAWNGQTFDSLSKVAFAITGTKWNGPRFFGLRERDIGPTSISESEAG